MKRAITRMLIFTALFFVLIIPLTADVSFLDRPGPPSFRLMSYNPYWNAIFQTGIRRYAKSEEFARVLTAVKPDIAVLQEVGPTRSTSSLVAIFNSAMPLPEGDTWSVARSADNVIVSRFRIVWSDGRIASGSGTNARGHVLALIELPDGQSASEILVGGVHFKSGGSRNEVAARTKHSDVLTAHIREARIDEAVPTSAPVILAGDFNAYATDPRRHMNTLIHGDVDSEAGYGPDGSLEPSGADMVDLLPTHNGAGRDTWTWRDDTQQFDPYPLDRILFTGSTLDVIGSFVLNTAVLTEADLTTVGLEVGDVALDLDRGIYDHLPVVADMAIVRHY